MKDLIHRITKYVDHDRYKVMAIVATVVLIIAIVGCQSKTASIADPAVLVTAAEFDAAAADLVVDMQKQRIALDAAIAAYNADAAAIDAKIATGVADLVHRDQVRTELVNVVGGVISQAAAGNPITLPGVIGTVIAAVGILGGLGSAADSRRKDATIKRLNATE